MIQEAESLATHIDTLDENQEQMRLIYRWAETADGVAKLMVLAEELLSESDAYRKMANRSVARMSACLSAAWPALSTIINSARGHTRLSSHAFAMGD